MAQSPDKQASPVVSLEQMDADPYKYGYGGEHSAECDGDLKAVPFQLGGGARCPCGARWFCL